MKKVVVIGCGAYMDSGYGCPGEWRCLKAAALGEGKFDEPVQVIAHVKCECPGRSLANNVAMATKLSEIKPDEIYLSSCLVNAKPECPHLKPEELKQLVENKFGIPISKARKVYAEAAAMAGLARGAAADLNELFAHYYNSVPEGVINDRFTQQFSFGEGTIGGAPHRDFRTPEYASMDQITDWYEDMARRAGTATQSGSDAAAGEGPPDTDGKSRVG